MHPGPMRCHPPAHPVPTWMTSQSPNVKVSSGSSCTWVPFSRDICRCTVTTWPLRGRLEPGGPGTSVFFRSSPLPAGARMCSVVWWPAWLSALPATLHVAAVMVTCTFYPRARSLGWAPHNSTALGMSDQHLSCLFFIFKFMCLGILPAYTFMHYMNKVLGKSR